LPFYCNLPKAIRKTVQNSGGGHLNHSCSECEPQAGGTALARVGQAITTAFGGFIPLSKRCKLA